MQLQTPSRSPEFSVTAFVQPVCFFEGCDNEAPQETWVFLVVLSDHSQLSHCSPIPPTFGSASNGIRQESCPVASHSPLLPLSFACRVLMAPWLWVPVMPTALVQKRSFQPQESCKLFLSSSPAAQPSDCPLSEEDLPQVASWGSHRHKEMWGPGIRTWIMAKTGEIEPGFKCLEPSFQTE